MIRLALGVPKGSKKTGKDGVSLGIKRWELCRSTLEYWSGLKRMDKFENDRDIRGKSWKITLYDGSMTMERNWQNYWEGKLKQDTARQACSIKTQLWLSSSLW